MRAANPAVYGATARRSPPAIERDNRMILVNGDCRDAGELLPDLVGRVGLVITSPPYHNAIAYDTHVHNETANYRTRSASSYDTSYAEDYLPLLDGAWSASWNMLKPGGYLAVNVGTVLLDGYHFPLPQDVLAHLIRGRDVWEYIRTIGWHKVTAGVKRAGSVIQRPIPGYWYSNILTEHIIVVRKPGPWLPLNTSNTPPEWWEPVWDLAPVPPNSVPHPAPFPEDLPHRLIRMLTQLGDLVMDPFNGAGATTKAAWDLGRVGLGFDLEPKYVEHAWARRLLASTVRPQQLVVRPTPLNGFVPGPSRGRTRHGSGLGTRGRNRATDI